MHFQSVRLPDEPAGSHFLVVDGQHGFAIQPFVWSIPPALPPYSEASKGTSVPETGLLDCWP